MALSSYWVAQQRKDLAEKAIVAKREKEAVRVQKCKATDSYHKDVALKTSKYKSLEEARGLKSARCNEESSVKENIKQLAKEKLENRRRRLAYILSVENDLYMKELKEFQDDHQEADPWNISKLKEQISDLQKKRKESEQTIQKKYMHEAFSSNIDFKNKGEDKQLQLEVSEAWQKRKEELEKLNLEKRAKEIERMKALELGQLKAIQEAKDIEKAQVEEQRKWSEIIQQKMDEFSDAEKKTKRLKLEKIILSKNLETLLTLQHRRTSVIDLKKKALQRLQTMWQAKEKLRRIQVEVLHSLDFDHKQTISIMAFNGSGIEDPTLALLDLDFVGDIRKKLEGQYALERERKEEIQSLYDEEAEKLLKKQLEQWSLESIARDELMNDLYKTLGQQIHAKLELNIAQERELFLNKESYLKEIDDASKQAKDSLKNLAEQQEYHLLCAKKMNDELLFQPMPHADPLRSTAKPTMSRPSSSRGESTLLSLS
ncbi:hypothetical protein JTE90_001272 [Oedothorax gibbosus]|uniref:Uncharacterized protein n=1 Tax=Oedothorax gibbosus TaxID=931172 RepID=A0AAV6V3R5_9ARAC|nr:hypothetical protein JTE90_001272 [Oedothorax gibbosus]